MSNFGIMRGLTIYDENFNKIEFLIVNDNPNNLSLDVGIGSLAINYVDGKFYKKGSFNWDELSTSESLNIFDFKSSVLCATTDVDGNIDLSNYSGTIDGKSLVNNGRYLIKNQINKTQNGIYVYNSSNNSFVRSSDCDENSEVTGGMVVPVSDGNINKNALFMISNADPIVVGVTEIDFIQIGLYVAGDGIQIVGNNIKILLDSDSGLFFNSGRLSIKNNASSIVKNSNNEIEVRGYSKINGVINSVNYVVIDSVNVSNSNTVNWFITLKKNNAIFGAYIFCCSDGVSVDFSLSNIVKVGVFDTKPKFLVDLNGSMIELKVKTDIDTNYYLTRIRND